MLIPPIQQTMESSMENAQMANGGDHATTRPRTHLHVRWENITIALLAIIWCIVSYVIYDYILHNNEGLCPPTIGTPKTILLIWYTSIFLSLPNIFFVYMALKKKSKYFYVVYIINVTYVFLIINGNISIDVTKCLLQYPLYKALFVIQIAVVAPLCLFVAVGAIALVVAIVARIFHIIKIIFQIIFQKSWWRNVKNWFVGLFVVKVRDIELAQVKDDDVSVHTLVN